MTTLSPKSKRQGWFLESECDLTIFGGAASGGKAQPLDQPVLTTDGWKPMGRISVGDFVITPKNKKSKVTHVWKHSSKDIYKITTHSGRVTRACADHLWNIKKNKKKSKSLLSTENTLDMLKHMNNGERVYIPVSDAIDSQELVDLPLDPYVLGILIAEGCLTTGQASFSSGDMEVVNKVNDRVLQYGCKVVTSSKDNHRIKMIGDPRTDRGYRYNTVQDIIKSLGLGGKSSYTKFIPKEYLYNSTIEQRFELLQGIMDGDGSIDHKLTCEVTTVSKRLSEDYAYLVRSLGGVSRTSVKSTSCKRSDGSIYRGSAYRNFIKFADISKAFSLQRKVDRCYTRKLPLYDQVVSIEFDGVEDAQCITIDDPDHLYLTDDFIVTHNSHMGLMRFLKYVHDPNFVGYVFRKNSTDLKKEGGLFWAAVSLFKMFNKDVTYTQQPMVITFPHPDPKMRRAKIKGATVSFTGIDDQAGMDAIQGIEISAAMVDEATQVGEEEFWYITSRLRTQANMSPNIWLTCNPDPSSFVLTQFVEWWLYPRDTMATKVSVDLNSLKLSEFKLGDYVYIDVFKDGEYSRTVDIGANISHCDNIKFYTISGSCDVNRKVIKDGVRVSTSVILNDGEEAYFTVRRYNEVTNIEDLIVRHLMSYVSIEDVGGRPDPAKNGQILYYLNINGKVHLAETEDELFIELPDYRDHPTIEPRTVRFIGATCKDNPTFLLKNPSYEGTLQNLPRMKKEQLYFGNWYAVEEGAGYFKREWVSPLSPIPDESDIIQRIRAWDLASSEPTESNPYPDYTAGVLISKCKYGFYYIEDVVRFRARAGDVEKKMIEVVQKDKEYYGSKYRTYLPIDPAGAGLIQKQHYATVFARENLAVYFKKVSNSKGKLALFEPFSASSQNGLVKCVKGEWNETYFVELEIFDGSRSTSSRKDD